MSLKLNICTLLKKTLAVIILCGISGMASAEAWIVDVSLSYVNSKVKLIENVPVLSFIVPVRECVKGLTRTEDMIPKPAKVTQEICVSKSGDITKIKGWVFAKNRITDLAFKGERGAADRGALNYGMPVSFEIDGGFVKFTSGHYTVTAARTMSIQ
jgi:hypothetical protein